MVLSLVRRGHSLRTYSLGFIVPASTLRYGSTLIEETCWRVSTTRSTRQVAALILRPIVLSSRPVEEAVRVVSSMHVQAYTSGIPIMPWHMLVQPLRAAICILTFPTPLMTPPDTSTYFMAACSGFAAVWGRGRKKSSGCALIEFCTSPTSAPAPCPHGRVESSSLHVTRQDAA
jgi:hypothetical protein